MIYKTSIKAKHCAIISNIFGYSVAQLQPIMGPGVDPNRVISSSSPQVQVQQVQYHVEEATEETDLHWRQPNFLYLNFCIVFIFNFIYFSCNLRNFFIEAFTLKQITKNMLVLYNIIHLHAIKWFTKCTNFKKIII